MRRPWPYASVELDSAMPPDAVTGAIGAVVAAWAATGLERDGVSFWGWVEPGGFKLLHLTPTPNGFRPVIRGEIAAFGSGSRIRIRMRPHAFVIVAGSVIWLGLGFDSLRMLSSGLVPGQAWEPVAFVIMYLVVVLSFWKDANASIREIRRLVESDGPAG